MPRFFQTITAPVAVGDTLSLTGQDAQHIRLSLRMAVGDSLTVCDGQGQDYDTVIEGFVQNEVQVRVNGVRASDTEPTLRVTLYQGYPKGDKLELIVQKAVELGVARVVPVVTARSIARPGDKGDKKQERWQRIADEAAGQCGRGCLPTVSAPLTFEQALTEMAKEPLLVLYEAGGQPLTALVPALTAAGVSSLGLFIGPEGGIAPSEIDRLVAAGGTLATLGKRILRCETAPLAALAAVMCLSGNMD